MNYTISLEETGAQSGAYNELEILSDKNFKKSFKKNIFIEKQNEVL